MPLLSEEKKQSMKEKAQATREAKKSQKPWKVVLQDGAEKKVWGMRTNGFNQIPSEVAYESNPGVRTWVRIQEMNINLKLYRV